MKEKNNKKSKINSKMSVWYSANPGKAKSGFNRPQISGNIKLTPKMVQMIIQNGEIQQDEYLELQISAWPEPHENNQPTHRGALQFSEEQIEEFNKQKKSA